MFWKGGVSKEGKNIMYVRSLFVDAGCHITLMRVWVIFSQLGRPTKYIQWKTRVFVVCLFFIYRMHRFPNRKSISSPTDKSISCWAVFKLLEREHLPRCAAVVDFYILSYRRDARCSYTKWLVGEIWLRANVIDDIGTRISWPKALLFVLHNFNTHAKTSQ